MRVTLRRLVALISVSRNRDGTSGMLMPWTQRWSRRWVSTGSAPLWPVTDGHLLLPATVWSVPTSSRSAPHWPTGQLLRFRSRLLPRGVKQLSGSLGRKRSCWPSPSMNGLPSFSCRNFRLSHVLSLCHEIIWRPRHVAQTLRQRLRGPSASRPLDAPAHSAVSFPATHGLYDVSPEQTGTTERRGIGGSESAPRSGPPGAPIIRNPASREAGGTRNAPPGHSAGEAECCVADSHSRLPAELTQQDVGAR